MWLNPFEKYCRLRRNENVIPILVATIYCMTFYMDFYASCTRINFHTNPNIQRRFMWRQVSHTVDDFVDGMMSGARNVFGDMLQPATQATPIHSPTGELLASEITRVKYIIRDPHTNKPMKIIKMGPPKKVVHVIGANRPNGMVKNKPHKHHESNRETVHHSDMKNVTKHTKQQQQQQQQHHQQQKQQQQHQHEGKKLKQPLEESEVIGGKINELDDSWKPVAPEMPAVPEMSVEPEMPIAKPYTNIKSYPMSQLHTNVMTLPLTLYSNAYTREEERQREDEVEDETDEHEQNVEEEQMEAKNMYSDIETDVQESASPPPPPPSLPAAHTYEVTEYVAEESVAHSQNQNYSSNYEIPSFRHVHKSILVTPAPPITSTTTRGTTTTAKTKTTTTTPEPPNYPAAFLNSLRNVFSARKSFPQILVDNFRRTTTSTEENVWLPLNHTISPFNYRLQNPKSTLKPTTTESLSTQPSIERYPVLKTPLIRPMKELRTTTTTTRPHTTTRLKSAIRTNEKHVTIHTSTILAPSTTVRSLRHRGTVKFGDKLNWE